MTLTNIRRLSLVSLALAMGSAIAGAAPPKGYTYSVVATLGTLAPPERDGIYHTGDFEPGGINGRGDVAFASDLAKSDNVNFGEGLFARYNRITREIAVPAIRSLALS